MEMSKNFTKGGRLIKGCSVSVAASPYVSISTVYLWNGHILCWYQFDLSRRAPQGYRTPSDIGYH